MSDSKKKRPISPQEAARRKEAAQKHADALKAPPTQTFGSTAGKPGKIAPQKTQNFRHQGR